MKFKIRFQYFECERRRKIANRSQIFEGSNESRRIFLFPMNRCSILGPTLFFIPFWSEPFNMVYSANYQSIFRSILRSLRFIDCWWGNVETVEKYLEKYLENLEKYFEFFEIRLTTILSLDRGSFTKIRFGFHHTRDRFRMPGQTFNILRDPIEPVLIRR